MELIWQKIGKTAKSAKLNPVKEYLKPQIVKFKRNINNLVVQIIRYISTFYVTQEA